jgi:hypothetical protein
MCYPNNLREPHAFRKRTIGRTIQTCSKPWVSSDRRRTRKEPIKGQKIRPACSILLRHLMKAQLRSGQTRREKKSLESKTSPSEVWTDLQIRNLKRWQGLIMRKKPAPREYSFRPELITAMRTAFQKACEAPQVRDAGGGAMEIAAEKILELAEAGETNPERLYAGALRRVSQ